MKKILFFFLISFSLEAVCQKSFLLDSTMKKAMSPKGYSDTKIDFKNFSARSSDDKVYTNDSLKNKVTFINFWFEHCAPCVAEFDALNNLYNKYKGNKDFQFLSFTFETSEDIQRITKEYHLEYPIIQMDREKIDELIYGNGFPTNIITGTSGTISFIKSGGFTDKENARKDFDLIFSKQIERLLFPQ